MRARVASRQSAALPIRCSIGREAGFPVAPDFGVDLAFVPALAAFLAASLRAPVARDARLALGVALAPFLTRFMCRSRRCLRWKITNLDHLRNRNPKRCPEQAQELSKGCNLFDVRLSAIIGGVGVTAFVGNIGDERGAVLTGETSWGDVAG
jgi:hypothetical protein